MPRDCTFLNLAFAFAATVVSAVLIVVLQPFTKNIELGSGKLIDTIEDILETVWSLFSKAAATTVMVIWTYTLTDYELLGLPALPPAALPATPAPDGLLDWMSGEAERLTPHVMGPAPPSRSVVKLHLNLYWAMSITLMGSLAAVKLEKVEVGALKHRPTHLMRPPAPLFST